jgi:hypothetical protein
MDLTATEPEIRSLAHYEDGQKIEIGIHGVRLTTAQAIEKLGYRFEKMSPIGSSYTAEVELPLVSITYFASAEVGEALKESAVCAQGG